MANTAPALGERIRSRPLEDQQVLQASSRARKRPPPQIAPEVVDRILAIRDNPPPKLGRTPGPVTILYYLQKDDTSYSRMSMCKLSDG